MAITFINSNIKDITYHLENQEFEGPLDLLLSMIKETKIDIRDIFLSDITDQFVSYVNNMKELNYEYVAEYITLAATLLEIKSSKFIPNLHPVEDDIDLVSEEENLYLRMEAYKLFKEKAEEISKMDTINRFYRRPKFTEDDYRIVATEFDLDRLIECFKTLIERIEEFETDNEAKTIIKERFTVADKIYEITNIIRENDEVKFFDLFGDDFTKLEIINTFLAILEILKKQIAFGYQEYEFSDILLKNNIKCDIVVDENIEENAKDVEKYN